MGQNRALVTGGAGLVGARLVEALIQRGTDVLIFDSLVHGHDLRRQAKEAWFVQGDLRDRNKIEFVIKSFRPDIVFHLAAIHFLPYCWEHPRQTLDVNVGGTDLLLRALGSSTSVHFVLASSAAVYGFSRHPLDENSPANPADVYGLSKLMAEDLLRRHATERPHARFVGARLFTSTVRGTGTVTSSPR